MEVAASTSGRSGASTAPAASHPSWRATLVGLILLVTSGFAVYANSYHAPLVFDGEEYVGNNPNLRTLWPLSVPMGGNSRPVTYLTFAANYGWGGGTLEGLHLMNIAIHILADLTLWGIVRRTLRWPQFKSRYAEAAEAL